MARDDARAPRGTRAQDEVPRNDDVRPVVGALTSSGRTAMFTYRGGTTNAAFGTHVREVLAPELEPGDAVVLDKLAAHTDVRVRELVEAAGATPYVLPPYSPEPHPIESAWPWIPRWLKTARARTEDAVRTALAMAIARIDPGTAGRWMRHGGDVHPVGCSAQSGSTASSPSSSPCADREARAS